MLQSLVEKQSVLPLRLLRNQLQQSSTALAALFLVAHQSLPHPLVGEKRYATEDEV